MHSLPLPLTRDVVLIGGGHSHALMLRAWGMDPLPGARLTVINPSATAPYTGMLPGFVAGHYGRDDLEIDLVRLARFAGARMIFGWATGIDRDNKMVHIDGHAPVAYDIASLDIGITSAMHELSGFVEHGIAAKPLGPYSVRWSRHLETGGGPVAVIGGGIAGVELALAMRHAMGADHAVSVVEAQSALAGVGAASRDLLLSEMTEQNINLIENAKVARVEADHIVLEDERNVPSELTVGAAGARPFLWLEDIGLDLTNGFVTVDETLTSHNDPNIFAVGDCAHLSKSPRPKAGVFAVRAAPILLDNIQARLTGGALRPFKPQSQYLKLVSLGRKSALADKWGRAIHGDWVWRWKDHIDQTFMQKLDNLPTMKRAALPSKHADGMEAALGPKPLCGGCGSKVGASVLNDVLRDLPAHTRDDISLTAGDDAA
ncbi:FAD-dependent oxidoreductase, partial [Rhodobacteraceae bacterium]|nr:FAD-dependent oxidoreductase [Paracoccaceae bacterium]